MGADIFPEGGRIPQNLQYPQNGSRGEDTLSLYRGGVEGGKGGTNQIFVGGNLDFYENKSRSQESFLQNKGPVSPWKSPFIGQIFFLKVPDFRL